MTWWVVDQADLGMRRDLLEEAGLVAEVVNRERVLGFTGTEADLGDPAYERLKGQLVILRKSNPLCRFIHVLGRKPGGEIFFFMDSEPAGSKDHSRPGQVYGDAPEGAGLAFDRSAGVVSGPFTDRWGKWISAVVPIREYAAVSGGKNGENLAVLGMCVDAHRWTWMLVHAGIRPFMFTLLLLGVVLAGSALLARRLHNMRLSSKPMRYLEPVLAAVAGMVLTLFVAWLTHDLEGRHNRDAFKRLAANLTKEVPDTLRNLRDTQIEGLARFIENNPNVTAEGFRQYTAYLAKNPAIEAWEWVPAVKAADRNKFEAGVRAGGREGFEIWQWDAQGNRVRSRGQEVYYPVLYASPPEESQTRVGCNSGADPLRHAALEKAAHTRLITATDPVNLLQDGKGQKGVVIFRPVFSGGDPGLLRGFVVAVLRMETMLESVGTGHQEDVEIWRLKENAGPELLAATRDGGGAATPGDLFFRPVVAFGQVFAVVAHARSEPMIRVRHPGQTGLLVALSGGLLTSALVIVIRVVQHRREELERAVIDMAKNRLIALHARDTLLLVSPEGKILEANYAAEELYGHTREELLQMQVHDLRPPGADREKVDGQMREALDGGVLFEADHVRKDGTLVPVEVNSRGVVVEGQKMLLSVVRNITERRISQARIARLTQLYTALSQCNHDIVHSVSEEELLPKICRNVVQYGGMKMAWIGRVDPASGMVRPVASFGEGTAYLEGIRISVDGTNLFGKGPAGASIRQKRPYWCQDFRNDPVSVPWREQVESYGWASAAALPLQTNGEVKMVFVVYSGVVHIFDEEVRKLLEGMAGDIGFALENLSRDAEHRQAEKALLESEERSRSILQTAMEGFWRVDGTGRLLEVNEAYCRMSGYSTAELLAMRIGDLESIESEVVIAARIQQIKTRGVARFESRHRRKDGTTFDIEASAQYLPKEDVIAAFIRDITRQKQAEETLLRAHEDLERRVEERTAELRAEVAVRERIQEDLRQREQTYRIVVENTGQVIYDLDVASGKVKRSGAIEAVTGYLVEEFENLDFDSWLAAIHPGDRPGIVSQLSQNQPGEFVMKYRFRRKDGGYAHILDKGVAISDQQNRIHRILGTMEDVTATKLLEEELRKAKHEADAANKAKSTFLANMSHEIRTPMNAILGFTQLALHEPDLSAVQRKRLEIISTSGSHLLDLINDILDISKIEAGRVELHLTTFDLDALLQELEGMFRIGMADKGLRYDVVRKGDVPRFIVADRSKLSQVLINLLVNAVKFTSVGGVTLRLWCGPATESRLYFEVEDTGSGIPEDEIRRLFLPFEQVHSDHQPGTGLGLAICRDLVRLMGGEINVTSEYGKGSVFRFSISLGEGRANKQHLNFEQDGTEKVTRQGYRVLIADDSENNRELLVEILRHAGFETGQAEDGANALEKFAAWRPHLILMDMRMPVMDGAEAIRRIRAMDGGREVRIVSITANVLENVKEVCLAAGADAYLGKPFRTDELFGIIGGLLGIGFKQKEETDSKDGPPAGVEIPELPAKELALLPAALVKQIREATINVDYDHLSELIRKVEPYNPKFAGIMLGLLERYDYPRIMEMLRER